MVTRRISRRKFLGMSAVGGAGLVLAGGISPSALAAPRTSFAPYKVALPVPPKAVKDTATGVYKMSVQETEQLMHPKLPNVKVWGYNNGAKTAGYLGPTIEVQKGETTPVEFTNILPAKHLLPVDPALVGTRGTASRILTHLHGGFVSGENDGNPYATQNEYGMGQTQTVTYSAQPRATTLWYHDHALGMTRLNVYAGLAGYFLVRDENDTGTEPNLLGIPGGTYEIPIVIQDKTFTANGQLFYSPDTNWIPEFFGDTIVINGAVQPFVEVEPRMYRLRFLNGSQSRFYHLELAGGPPFHQIGSEGGMFDAPVAVKSILLLPAERADVIVDFSGFDGQDLILKNRQLPAGVVSPATPNLPSLMQFRVRGPVTTPGPQEVPATLAGGSMPDLPGPPANTRYITLEEVLDAAGNPVRLEINGRIFDDPVDENPEADSIEDWSFVNISADTHPIHMHLTQFQVMGRAPLDGLAYAAALAAARAGEPGTSPLLSNNTIDPTPFLLGPEVPPPPNEQGWKDTVGAHPNQVTRIRQQFELPAGVLPPQKYVYHCHILEHEDNDMMRPYEVVPPQA